jgi:hypothetical protein
MAVRFKIRRSTTYNGAINSFPAAVGEMFHITTLANNPATGDGHKLYVGVGTETGGQASGMESIGGQYYTSMLDHVPGVLTPNAAILVDSNSRIGQLNIGTNGELRLFNTDNTFSTRIKADPTLASNYTLTLPPNDGNNGQTLITDGAGVLSWGTITMNNINIGNTANAYAVGDGTKNYIAINNVANVLTLGHTDGSIVNFIDPNDAQAFRITDSVDTYFNIDTNAATPITSFPTGNVTVSNQLNVNGGTINTTAATANVFNTLATTLNIGGAATAVSIGASTGTTTINNNLLVTGNITASGTTTLINSVNLSVQDALIELGLINGTAPSSNTGLDLGLKLNYYTTSPRVASIFYQNASGRFVLANNVTESAGNLTVATPTGSTTDYGTLTLGSVFVNDQACTTLGTAERVIGYTTLNGVAGRYLDNVILDGGVV